MTDVDKIRGPYFMVDDLCDTGYQPSMPLNQTDIRTLEAAIEVLDRVQDARLVGEVLMATGALSKVIRHCGSDAKVVAPIERPRIDGMAGEQAGTAYAGLSFAEAAVSHLATVRRSQRAIEILEALQRGGFEMTGERPLISLITAMRKREQNDESLVQIARGVWCLRGHMTEKERAAVQHKERTARGMQRAKAAGVTIGSKIKITAELAAKLKVMMEQGASNADMAAIAKVHKQTIYLARPKLEVWKPGEPWPPKTAPSDDDKDTDDSPLAHKLRVVQ
jgi:hypothetical protein